MNEIEFRKQVDEFNESVRVEALRLYAQGIDPARVLRIAIDIATATMLSRAEALARARRIMAVAPVSGRQPA